MEDKPDDTPDSAPPPAGDPRRRPAPTVDLTASEVTDTPQQAAETDEATPSAQPRKKRWARFTAGSPGDSTPTEPGPAEDDADALPKQHAPSHARTAIIAAM